MLGEQRALLLGELPGCVPAARLHRVNVQHIEGIDGLRREPRRRHQPRAPGGLRQTLLLVQLFFGFVERLSHLHRATGFARPGDGQLDRFLADLAAQNVGARHELVLAGVAHEIHDQTRRLRAGGDGGTPGLRRLRSVHHARQRPRRTPDHLRIQGPALRRAAHEDHLDARIIEALRQHAAVADHLPLAGGKLRQHAAALLAFRLAAHPRGHFRPMSVENLRRHLG